MKIGYFINQYPGISHSFVRREIQALEKLGVDIRRYAIRPPKQAVIAPEDDAEQRGTRHIITAGAVEIARTALASLVRAPLGSIVALRDAIRLGWRSEAGLLRHGLYFVEALVLAAWMRRDDVRHVHAHFGTNSATVAMLAADIADATFSFTVHGPEEFDKPGLISLRHKIEQAAFVVAISSFGRSQLRRLVSADHWEKLKIVHCGVEDAFFEGAESAPVGGDRFVCVGRLCEQKGQITLVEGAAQLKRMGKDFSLVLVGDGEMREEIETAARLMDVADRIEFAGWKTPSEVRAAIEGARAFVLPSYAEGLPVSIMEAFLIGRPVISTYIAGIPELVRPGENGWLAPAGDADALAEAMRQALDASDDDIIAMGRRGKAVTEARHSIDIEAAKLKRHFDALSDAA
ncbi:MAG: glycosyltransferase family 4 protein [Pseudomonadota bacterium]